MFNCKFDEGYRLGASAWEEGSVLLWVCCRESVGVVTMLARQSDYADVC